MHMTSLPDGTMVDKLAQFDLTQEIETAERNRPWPSGHHAKMLFKKHDLRVLLILLESNARMNEHHADGTLTLQVLKGRLRVNVAGKPHDLAVGNLFTLGASIRHDVEALEVSAFLLTISWPSAEELAAMKHRGYGS
jgi:quercetin dioxygenase-like cupin family protein